VTSEKSLVLRRLLAAASVPALTSEVLCKWPQVLVPHEIVHRLRITVI
jgi:hypothetical protein